MHAFSLQDSDQNNQSPDAEPYTQQGFGSQKAHRLNTYLIWNKLAFCRRLVLIRCVFGFIVSRIHPKPQFELCLEQKWLYYMNWLWPRLFFPLMLLHFPVQLMSQLCPFFTRKAARDWIRTCDSASEPVLNQKQLSHTDLFSDTQPHLHQRRSSAYSFDLAVSPGARH